LLSGKGQRVPTDDEIEASVRRMVTHGVLEWTGEGYVHHRDRWDKLMGIG